MASGVAGGVELMSEAFADLGGVVEDACFPAVDTALRRGRHVHKSDEAWYAFLSDAQPLLEAFYLRYGYELVHRSDGYFFLLPARENLARRQLTVAEMIVGQALALAYLDPSRLARGGVISKEDLLNQLASVLGPDALIRAFNPKRKRIDERVMQRTVRQKVAEATRRLSQLGFVELLAGDQLRLPPSLLRFAEPVRGQKAPAEALSQLLARGEVSFPSDESAEQEELAEEADETASDEETGGLDEDAEPSLTLIDAALDGPALDEATADSVDESAVDRA